MRSSSMLSTKDSVGYGSPNRAVALFRDIMVAVYTVDKTDITLTHQDLVELIHVCTD